MAKNGKVTTLNNRSDNESEIMKGDKIWLLVFLWYIIAAMINKLNVKPTTAKIMAKDPPKFASMSL